MILKNGNFYCYENLISYFNLSYSIEMKMQPDHSTLRHDKSTFA